MVYKNKNNEKNKNYNGKVEVKVEDEVEVEVKVNKCNHLMIAKEQLVQPDIVGMGIVEFQADGNSSSFNYGVFDSSVTCPGKILSDISRLEVLIGGKRSGTTRK